jgi:hypothetical protein
MTLRWTFGPKASLNKGSVEKPIPTEQELAEFRRAAAQGCNSEVRYFLNKYRNSGLYVDIGPHGFSAVKLASLRGHRETVVLLEQARIPRVVLQPLRP